MFYPHVHPERLKPLRVRKPATIFVVSMGDLFCDAVPDVVIRLVLEAMAESKGPITWFLETKNPARYRHFLNLIPPNTILSTTIEGTDDFDWDGKTRLSRAPLPRERYLAFANLDWPRKHVSIEPILGFELDDFVSWIKDIGPERVSIGYDNWGLKLPEPTLEHTLRLIHAIRKLGIEVEIKTLRPAYWEPRTHVLPLDLELLAGVRRIGWTR